MIHLGNSVLALRSLSRYPALLASFYNFSSQGIVLYRSDLLADDNKAECGSVDTETEASAHYESCSSPESQTDAERHYEILTFKTDVRDDTADNRLYEPIENHTCFHDGRNDRSVRERFSSKPKLRREARNFLETSFDSAIRTIPMTVTGNKDARCLKRILINEETLNEIIVPTASTESEKDTESRRDRGITNINGRDEVTSVDDPPARTIRDQGTECTRKDNSVSRNVFVKTKRMIFGPFRRSEDRSASRKESDGSVDGRLSRSSKSKSKSRSASPKLCRQDALLRVSLSLPWPLRSASKTSEIPSEADSRRSSGSKPDDAIARSERDRSCAANKKPEGRPIIGQGSSFVDVNSARTRQDSRNGGSNASLVGMNFLAGERSRATSIEQDRGGFARRMRDEVDRDETRDREQTEGKQEERKRERSEATRQDRPSSNANCGDAVPSDLMHKLRILSDAAARREGRANPCAESSISCNSESRSSRIRRAKESFLSRRGGPFCRSTMQPEAADCGDPWRRRRSASQASTESTMITSNYEGVEGPPAAGRSAEIIQRGEGTCSREDKVDACREKDAGALDVGVQSESLVKSASAGMINVDTDAFGRFLVPVDRGCESLPRTIAKRRESAGPLAKIVSKLKLSRLIRARNATDHNNGGNMSTISTLCRQSLLIDMRRDIDHRPDDERQAENQPVEIAENEDRDDRPDGDAKNE